MGELDVLIVGSGGREYELARQLGLSPKVGKVYAAPGNSGTAALPKTENADVGPTDTDKVVAFVQEKNIGLTVLGPDAAVAAGLGNVLRKAGATVFGPTREAGRLEASKSFAAAFMGRHGIPHPASWVAHSLQEALDLVKDRAPNEYVIKADGLASGRGVVLPHTLDEADEILREMFSGAKFGGAGKDMVVIQERLHGPELSAFAVSDGKNIVLLPLVQDHKRLKDNDQGPNTGGMGVYGPVSEAIVSPEQTAKIREIAVRTIAKMAEEGVPYEGVLYMGLMLAKEHGGNPMVIEYNARFGDPETQVLLPMLNEAGVDVADMLLQAARGDVSKVIVPDKPPKAALTVALAAAGYPDNPLKGAEIFGLDRQYEGVIVQYAGARHKDGKWTVNVGREIFVTGIGDDVGEAANRAYAAIGEQGIHFQGMQYRTDIGWQARIAA